MANLASLVFNLNGQESDVNFLSTTGTALANAHFTYDGNLRPVNSTGTWQSGSGASGTIFSSNRVYDPVGNVITVSTTQAAIPGQSGSGGSETQNFCYDELSRVVWAGNSGSQPGAGNGTCGSATLSNTLSGATYSNSSVFTHLGQIWQRPLNGSGTPQQYLYCDSSHPHQLSGVYPSGTTCATRGSTTASYGTSYDSFGNAITRTYNSVNATLSYDVLDELVQWDAGSSNKEWYVYDGGGQRTLRRSTTGSGTTLTVYAFGLEEHTYGASGTPTGSTYYYSLGGRLLGTTNGSSTTFFLTDALGSILSTFSNVAGSAQVLGNQVYGPYGNKRYAKGSMGTTKGFTGQYEDSTGLDYFNARYYDPVLGRFVSADVVQGNMQGMDPYDYTGGNPLTFTDPSGMDIWGSISGTFNNAVNSVSNVVNQAGNDIKKGAVELLDATTGIPSMINDVQVLFDSNKSWQEKLLAGGDLLLNAALDVSMLTGVGELARGGKILLDIGEHAAVDFGEHAFEHEAASVVEHAGVDEAEHTLMNTTEHATTEVLDRDVERTAEKEAGKSTVQETEHAATSKAEHTAADTAKPSTSGGACSFTTQTLVSTTQGKQAIGTLQVGQQVLAYNPTTQKTEYEPILHVWVHSDDDLVDLTIQTPATTEQGTGPDKETTSEVIHTNKKHPFLTVEEGFTPVADLHVDMHIIRADGSVGVITAWRVVPGQQVMYNLEVQHDHTFTVGDDQWVVHNCNEFGKRTFTDRNGVERWANLSPSNASMRRDLAGDIDRVEQNIRDPHYRHDGTVFGNYEGVLPQQPHGYYQEWVVPTPGERGPGSQRIITGGPLVGGRYSEMWFTIWHYSLAFYKIY